MKKEHLCELSYSKIAADLRSAIDSQHLSHGEMLLPERELARRYSVSIGTVRRGIRTLVEEGRLRKRQGLGTFVLNRTETSGAIALLLPTLQLSYYARIAELVEKYGSSEPFIITNPDDVPVSRRISIAQKRRGFRNVIITHEISSEEYDRCRRHFPGMEFFFFDSGVSGLPVNSVCSDEIEGARLAVTHLLNQGRRRIVFLGNTRFANGRRRALGCRLALENAGEKFHLIDSDVHYSSAYAAMQNALARGLRPTGIFAVTDMAAMGGISALREAGVRVPEDCAVIGYSNLAEGKNFTPALSTIETDLDGMVRYTLSEIAFRTAHPETELSQVRFQPRLIVRASSSTIHQPFNKQESCHE